MLWPIKESVFLEKEGEENKREIPEKEKEENSKHKWEKKKIGKGVEEQKVNKKKKSKNILLALLWKGVAQ